MKRTLISILLLALLVTLTACGGGEKAVPQTQDDAAPAEASDASASAPPAPEAGSKYVLTYRDCPLPMNAEFAPLLDFLGEPDSCFEAASCAFDGLDKTYTYDGMEIITYPDEERDYISSVRILDSGVSTPEGITIGSTPEEVTAACGEDFQDLGSQYVYEDGDARLSILFEDGAAISVEYTAINDLLG